RRGGDQGENHARQVGVVAVEQRVAAATAGGNRRRQVEQGAAPADQGGEVQQLEQWHGRRLRDYPRAGLDPALTTPRRQRSTASSWPCSSISSLARLLRALSSQRSPSAAT